MHIEIHFEVSLVNIPKNSPVELRGYLNPPVLNTKEQLVGGRIWMSWDLQLFTVGCVTQSPHSLHLNFRPNVTAWPLKFTECKTGRNIFANMNDVYK